MLAALDGTKGIVVYNDVFRRGLGYVLMHRGRVIVYTSRQFRLHEKNYSIYDLKFAAAIFALKIWKYYLLGSRVGPIRPLRDLSMSSHTRNSI